MEETPTPDLPKWTKPLTSIAECVECLDTDEYDVDWSQRLEALTFLTERKQELVFDLGFAVPQGEHWLTRTKDPAWGRVVSLTEDRCGCGQHRVIVGGSKTNELAADDRLVVVSVGSAVELVARGLHKRQTAGRISVKEDDGLVYVSINTRPYSETFNLKELLGSNRYTLDGLAESVAKRGGPLRLLDMGWVIGAIHAVDPVARTITICPNDTFEARIVKV